MKSYICLTILILSTSILARLEEDNCTNNFCYQTTVKRIGSQTKSENVIILINAKRSRFKCQEKYLKLIKNNAYESSFALLLTSYIHDKKVSLKLSDEPGKFCNIDYVYIN